jgi:hypothetical protein
LESCSKEDGNKKNLHQATPRPSKKRLAAARRVVVITVKLKEDPSIALTLPNDFILTLSSHNDVRHAP